MSDLDAPCPKPPYQPPPRAPTPPSLTSARSLRQLSLFAAGSTFLALSTLITRRAVARRRLAIFPSFYHPSNQPPKQAVHGGLEAVEALGLATVNVVSFGMMIVGGALWAFDIAGVEDLRRTVRGGLGVDGTGRGEREVEEEWEEWLAGVVERRRRKDEGAGRRGARGERGEVDGDGDGDGVEEGVVGERGKRR
ncbi:hypothetical protein MMC11_000787 [Xylographa trunciseda]|nr:hypothetical protein [Xylographa trunciseda]